MSQVRVLVVDDSATIRHLLSMALARDPEIEVVGAAPGPAVARQMIKELNPDVITLDIEMPNMSGLEFLEKIMRLRPMPVVMVSTLTERGAGVTLDALAMGAVDYYPKPKENVAAALERAGTELANKVKVAARAKVRARVPKSATTNGTNGAAFKPSKKIVAIGSSTGGVEALIEVLSHFPENCPPTVITQHMPGKFTTSFAERLDRLCKATVAEASEGAPLKVGHIYLAPGSELHMEIGGQTNQVCRLRNGDNVSGHRPSVDVLFQSVARNASANAVGVLLTGMGRDGAEGLKAMREAGARTIGQDESSSVVYGMPRAAFEIGAVERQFPLEKIGEAILDLCAIQGGA
jgi:two-component system, chemotaxis family, protein-glutamate methylesterase/glutaminase